MNIQPKSFYISINMVALSMAGLILLYGCQEQTESFAKDSPVTQTKDIDLSAKDSAVRQGTDFFVKGEYEKAVETFTGIIDLYPDYYDGYYGRGMAYGRLTQYERAIEDYGKTLQLNPPNPSTVYNSRAVLQMHLGRYELSIQDLNMVIELNPKGDANLSNAYYGRGIIYWKLGRFEEAERDIRKAKELGFEQNIEQLLQQIKELNSGR